MSITVRVSDEQTKMIQEMATLYNLTVSEFVRNTVMEKIEDEFDLRALREAMAEHEKSGGVVHSAQEVAKEFGVSYDEV